MFKLWWVLGAGLLALGVAVGAFGAHGLKARVEPAMLQNWETGARYHMYHALGLLAVATLSRWTQGAALTAAGVAFCLGILLFSGSLYVMTLTGARWLGAITPLGGVAFIGGWALLAWAGTRAQP